MAGSSELLALRELLRRAVLTLATVPDSDLRYRIGPRTAWPAFVRQARDAYGYAPPRIQLFQPTRRDLDIYLVVLQWLGWFERTYGPETPAVFRAWCLGAPMWMLQRKISTNRRSPASQQTLYNRFNLMAQAIAYEFPENTRYIDISFGLGNFSPADTEDAGLSSDLRSLPLPAKNWRSQSPAPLSVAEQAIAHEELGKKLKRNGLRALKRQGKP